MPYNTSIPQDDTLHPLLDQARDAFTTPAAQDWSDDIITDVQQHLNEVNVADANEAAGHQFVQNLASTKDNLIGMVKADPTSAPLAIRIAPKLLAGIVNQSGASDEDVAGIHEDLTQHVRGEVARAAITSMGNIHAEGARQLMGMMSDHLTDDDRAILGAHIDVMENARQRDATASQFQMQQDQAHQSRVAAYKYGGGLFDKRTEETVFPHNYLSGLMQDQTISPYDKRPLLDAYSRLEQYGDPPNSNPFTATHLLEGIANGRTDAHEIMSHVGTNLTYTDARMLHALTTVRTPEAMAATTQLSNLMTAAQSQLGAGGSRANDAAYGRFVDWLLPSYRKTGPAGLNPTSPNYLFNGVGLADFAPKHDDLTPPPEDGRPPLGSIFGRTVKMPLSESEAPDDTEPFTTRLLTSRRPNSRADPGMVIEKKDEPDDTQTLDGLPPQSGKADPRMRDI